MKSKCCMPAISALAVPTVVFGMMKMAQKAMSGQEMEWNCDKEAADETASWEDVGTSAPEQDIIDVAVAAGTFSTLAQALEAADLVATLKGDGPFTVLAPTDEAFAALPEGTLEDLLKPENKERLVKILTYHVIPERLLAADLISQKTATAVNGQNLNVGLKINDATLTQADITAANGVIHVIDKVLLPV